MLFILQVNTKLNVIIVNTSQLNEFFHNKGRTYKLVCNFSKEFLLENVFQILPMWWMMIKKMVEVEMFPRQQRRQPSLVMCNINNTTFYRYITNQKFLFFSMILQWIKIAVNLLYLYTSQSISNKSICIGGFVCLNQITRVNVNHYVIKNFWKLNNAFSRTIQASNYNQYTCLYSVHTCICFIRYVALNLSLKYSLHG